MKKEGFWRSFWVALYQIGMFVVWIVAFLFIKDLPPENQWALALASSVIYFISSILFSKIKTVKEEFRNQPIRWRWVGAIQLILAIMFLTVIKPGSDLDHWTWGFNLIFGSYSVLIAYIAIASYLFPVPQQETAPPPDPLADLPQDLQNLVEEGRNIAAKATINTTAICALLILVSVFFLGELNSPLTFMGAEVLAAIVIIIIARYIASYQWQKQALQSGIPAKTLESAAKLAGLPWLNIKEN